MEAQTAQSPVEHGRQFIQKKCTIIVTTKHGGKKKKTVGFNFNHIRRFLADLSVLKSMLMVKESSVNLAEEVVKLRAKLAYQTGKYQDLRVLQGFLNREMQGIGQDKQKFDAFVLLVESIVAYHKFYGGKET